MTKLKALIGGAVRTILGLPVLIIALCLMVFLWATRKPDDNPYLDEVDDGDD